MQVNLPLDAPCWTQTFVFICSQKLNRLIFNQGNRCFRESSLGVYGESYKVWYSGDIILHLI